MHMNTVFSLLAVVLLVVVLVVVTSREQRLSQV